MMWFCLCVWIEWAFCMEALIVGCGIMTLLVVLIGVLCPNDHNRVLRGEIWCLRARMADIEFEGDFMFRHGKERTRADKLSLWIDDGRKLLEKVEGVLRNVEAWRGALWCPKMRDVVGKWIETVRGHEEEGHLLLKRGYLPKHGSIRGNSIPARELICVQAVSMLRNLQNLLQCDEVGSIVIYGVKGIGKTLLMKYLCNCVLRADVFDRVIWATSPAHFTIENVQETVASAIKCDLPLGDDLHAGAAKLSDSLAGLGRFVFFLDDVPEASCSLDEAGILNVIKGSGSKLVLTTTSSQDSRISNGFVEVNCLPQEEAYQLFLHEAGIDMESIAAFGDNPRLLAAQCHGVPGMIVGIAAPMFGIHDLREWRNAVFESRSFGEENNLRLQ